MIETRDAVAMTEPVNKSHPLGPLIVRRRLAHPVRSRLIAAAILAALAAPLVAAAMLTPDPSGAGTHRQLGLQSCSMLARTGYPCPTCGMTTAFAHTVRGQWRSAFHAQPMGWLLAVSLFAALGATLVTLADGKAWEINWYRISPAKTVIAILLLFAAAWCYKIISVSVTMGSLAVLGDSR